MSRFLGRACDGAYVFLGRARGVLGAVKPEVEEERSVAREEAEHLLHVWKLGGRCHEGDRVGR